MKSLISVGVLAASLALSANAAMAAAQPVHTAATTAHVIRAVWPDVRRARAYHGPYRGAWPYAGYAASGDVPQSQFGFDAGQFIQGLLGGGSVRYANLARDVRSLPASRGYSSPALESPSYDYSASTSDAQNQANEQANQMQQMNDENALISSMQAAEQQNEAANAATIQTEINAAN